MSDSKLLQRYVAYFVLFGLEPSQKTGLVDAAVVLLDEDEHEMDVEDIDVDADAAVALVPYHEQLQVPSLHHVADNDDGQGYHLSDVARHVELVGDGNCSEAQSDFDDDGCGNVVVAAVEPLYAPEEDHTDSSLQFVIEVDILADIVVADYGVEHGTLHAGAAVEVEVEHQPVAVAEAPWL